MAKRIPPPAPEAPVMVAPISAKTQHLIDAIRSDFKSFVDGFRVLNTKRADLAPAFMKAYGGYQNDTGGGFVTFCRVLVPEIPLDRDGYRAHPAYQAATYLRRLQSPAAERGKKIKPEDRPVTPLRALAVLVQTVLPILDPQGILWGAFVKEMNWTDEQAQRIQKLGVTLGPLHLRGKPAQVLHVERRAA